MGTNARTIAVGVMIGIAGYTTVASLIQHVLLPPLGYVIQETDFAELSFEIPVEGDDPVEIKYGLFFTALVSLIAILIVTMIARWLRHRRMDNQFYDHDG